MSIHLFHFLFFYVKSIFFNQKLKKVKELKILNVTMGTGEPKKEQSCLKPHCTGMYN